MLDDLCFTVEPGEVVALTGPSGAGKSSTIKLMSRLYDPEPRSSPHRRPRYPRLPLSSLRGQIAAVLQENTLFAASIRDNIAYGGIDVSDAEIEEAARLANAHEFIENLPEGFETVVGERGVTLSAGQRQRIAVARAAVSKAPAPGPGRTDYGSRRAQQSCRTGGTSEHSFGTGLLS